jgi:hypothetical protein
MGAHTVECEIVCRLCAIEIGGKQGKIRKSTYSFDTLAATSAPERTKTPGSRGKQATSSTAAVKELAKVAVCFPQSAYAGLQKSLQQDW